PISEFWSEWRWASKTEYNQGRRGTTAPDADRLAGLRHADRRARSRRRPTSQADRSHPPPPRRSQVVARRDQAEGRRDQERPPEQGKGPRGHHRQALQGREPPLGGQEQRRVLRGPLRDREHQAGEGAR